MYMLYLYIDAARRLFSTKSDEASLKENGIYDVKVRQQRRRNRIIRVSQGCTHVCYFTVK